MLRPSLEVVDRPAAEGDPEAYESDDDADNRRLFLGFAVQERGGDRLRFASWCDRLCRGEAERDRPVEMVDTDDEEGEREDRSPLDLSGCSSSSPPRLRPRSCSFLASTSSAIPFLHDGALS